MGHRKKGGGFDRANVRCHPTSRRAQVMAYLTEDVLETGRGHLRAGDLERFIEWVEEVPISIDVEVVRSSMGKCLAAGNTERALKLFEAVWPVTDPVADAWVGLRRMTIVAVVGGLVLFGLLGGVVYFFRALS